MKKQQCAINFQDERGTISDIFSHSPKDHITLIFSKAGAVRGSHYHKHSTQYTFVISGRMTVLSRPLSGGSITEETLGPYDMVTHDPNEIHTLIAEEDTLFLALADGVRGGHDYEKDTFRVSAEDSGLDAYLARARSSRT